MDSLLRLTLLCFIFNFTAVHFMKRLTYIISGFWCCIYLHLGVLYCHIRRRLGRRRAESASPRQTRRSAPRRCKYSAITIHSRLVGVIETGAVYMMSGRTRLLIEMLPVFWLFGVTGAGLHGIRCLNIL